MATSGKTELDYLIPEVWASEMYDELRSSLLMANFFNRDYEKEIAKKGDTVHVQQITAPSGQETQDDKDLIVAEELNVNQIDIVADRIARASFELTNLADLQSQSFQADAQEALVYAVAKIVEDRIIASMIPSAAAPDHIIAPAAASDLAAADLAGIRTLMSKQYIPTTNRMFWGDPQYYGDLLGETNFVNSQYIPAGSPTSSGSFGSPLYGFQIEEHNGLAADTGYAAHRSALTIVMQKAMSVKISDLHPVKKDGYLITASVIFGLKLMDNKRIVKISG
jgi:hypothetical protein